MLILASQSPRRRELLAQLGLDFQIQPANIDETPRSGESPESYVTRMAIEKARGVAASGDGVVLGSDTSVVLEGWVMGKPANEAEATRMLTALSGTTHRVLSSVALVQGETCRHAITDNRVTFRSIEPAEIRAYWRTGEPRDKAGAYAIQGLGAMFVSHLAGSYSAVMGLPLFETAQLLKAVGLHPFSR